MFVYNFYIRMFGGDPDPIKTTLRAFPAMHNEAPLVIVVSVGE